MERRGLGVVVGEEEMRAKGLLQADGPSLVAGKGVAAITRTSMGWTQYFRTAGGVTSGSTAELAQAPLESPLQPVPFLSGGVDSATKVC